ncbi:Conserved hypothetical protein [Prochlorococcus marinus str. MIT 9313]|uniref:Uncharacterized protein n=1 Tax=Prochlorococcus marinus (strain MIT 9313) TaxID=74547 RepID=B9ER75_PROMM|nr:hypothetical protein [Prochlorococcus marinus]CAX32123.1 Conserved hypothetical protein [Prochlorococcus marinus str. MIT 9313]
MSRRRPTILERFMHQWRRVRRHELTRTLRHMHYQQKRAAYVRTYVEKSLSSIDRAEGKIQSDQQSSLADQDYFDEWP